MLSFTLSMFVKALSFTVTIGCIDIRLVAFTIPVLMKLKAYGSRGRMKNVILSKHTQNRSQMFVCIKMSTNSAAVHFLSSWWSSPLGVLSTPPIS